MAGAITVDFGQPMPMFPLEGFVLLPHVVQPLHVFEQRYRQMVRHCLGAADAGGGQIALASFASSTRRHAVARELRPVVCVGHIVRHEGLADGRSNILVQGICRGRIVAVEEPDDEHLYHRVKLSPIEPDPNGLATPPGVRDRLRRLLTSRYLKRMSTAPAVLEWIAREEIPTHAVLEIAGYALIQDELRRYELLEEPTIVGRVRIIQQELVHLADLVRRGERQGWRDWPRGMSWN